ncbi:MAG: DUF547 domain-containing protein [Pseudomonadota bacterium]
MHKVLSILLAFSFSTALFADSNHAIFNPLLNKYVDDGFVDYPGFNDAPVFEQYIQELGQPLETTDRDEQLAFWINAYNAFAIKGILDGRSPSSFFGRIGYFKNAKYEIGGQTINLYDLERDIIIPFDEPRIHFAINCASVSCPKLQSEVYIADQLETQLEESTVIFINDETRNKFDTDKKVAHISKIFDWFEKDFVKHSGSVQKYIAQYVDDPIIAEDLNNEEYKIVYLDYDWNLNGKPVK